MKSLGWGGGGGGGGGGGEYMPRIEAVTLFGLL